MKIFIALAVVCIIAVNALSRSKRQAYELPDGASLLLRKALEKDFKCDNQNNGYYADVANDCRVFHICHTNLKSDGTSETLQWSFACGNQTVFNQRTLTCTFPEDAVLCAESNNYFFLNDRLFSDDPEIPFLTAEDIS
ncbi:uncharacterized protein LOC143232155 [Tachypleus tridentatus]|uniref:uncharacterized protein LOC143232155 n=1 Tax=Tachypleus tridentatus TaxID=6853 RepID=UPI003FD244F0